MSTGATPFEDSPLDSVKAWTQEALSVVPTPEGVSSRELVLEAIEMRGPTRLPYSFVEPLQSDFFELCELERRLNPHRKLSIGESYTDVWQVEHEVAKGLFDRVVDHPLRDLSALSDYEFPAGGELVDLNTLRPFVQRACGVGKYIVAADPVLLFERLRSLMGFESMMLAPRKQAARFSDLLDALAGLTVKSVESLGQLEGIDSFMSWQDFGAQTGLMIRVEEFRELYKPGLERVVRATHEQGLHFVLHSCGELRELIPDFIEIGVDVLQLDQAKLLGYEFLRKEFGGEICFWNTVDTLWYSQACPSENELRAEVQAMVEAFADLPGGLMARHYPQPGDIGLPAHFHEITRSAFGLTGE